MRQHGWIRETIRTWTCAALAMAMLAAPAALIPAEATAQEAGKRARANFRRELRDRMFPPKMLIRHADAIGLTEGQRADIKEAIKRTQSENVDVQFKLQQQAQKLLEMLDDETVDAEEALAQADRVMALEHEVKRNHLKLMLTIKNLLTPEQQAQLRAIIEE